MTSVNFPKRVQPPRSDGATDHWPGRKKPRPPETRDCYYAAHEELCSPPSFRSPPIPGWKRLFAKRRLLREAGEIVEKAGRLHESPPEGLRYFFEHDLERLNRIRSFYPAEVGRLLEQTALDIDDPRARPWVGLVRTACGETDGFLDLISLLE